MACPYAAGLAGLILSEFPTSTLQDVKKAIYAGAEDLSNDGWDQYFGFGRVNVNDSLKKDGYHLLARMTSPKAYSFLDHDFHIRGSALGSNFLYYTIEIGQGNRPDTWTTQGITLLEDGEQAVFAGQLASLDISGLGDGTWTLRLTVFDSLNHTKEMAVTFNLDAALQANWPQTLLYGALSSPVAGDIDNDGDLEIVTNSYLGIVYAWHHDGTLVSGWPQFMNHLGGAEKSSPALADLDGDGDLEIICGSNDSYDPNFYIWHHDGTYFPGWPQEVANYISQAPVVEDIDNDGDLEIIFPGEDWRVHAYHHDGTRVDGWPVRIDGSQRGTKVVVGDIDNDGYKEILSSDSGGNMVFAWNHDGTSMSGWPKVWTDASVDIHPAAIGDINKDGTPEVITGGTEIHVWNGDGNPIKGWPKILLNERGRPVTFFSPALGDLDDDGNLDIVAVDDNDTLHAFRGDGTYLPGWPREFGFHNPAWIGYCILADIDGDMMQEIILPARDSYWSDEYIYAFNHDGTLADGWPKQGVEHSVAPVVADLDADGDVEVIAPGNYEGDPDVNIFVWDLDGLYDPEEMDWPMFACDLRNTGNYPLGLTYNHPPGIGTIGGREIYAGEEVSFYVIGTDPDGDSLSYDAWLEDGSDLSTIGADLSTGILGDVDKNDVVNVLDKILVRKAFGAQIGDSKYNPRCDFDNNGLINILDKLILRDTFGDTLDTGKSVGFFSWTPENTQAGVYEIVFQATDAMGARSAETGVTITVLDGSE
jgi:hypothetical protein